MMLRVDRKRGLATPTTMTSTTRAMMMALSWFATRLRSWNSRSGAGLGSASCASMTSPSASSSQKPGPMAPR